MLAVANKHAKLKQVLIIIQLFLVVFINIYTSVEAHLGCLPNPDINLLIFSTSLSVLTATHWVNLLANFFHSK